MATSYTGGCLCGGLRYEADGEPMFAGHCYCTDCRKASGAGFIPFMGFAATAVRFTGEAQTFISKSCKDTDSARNFCPTCGGLVFGGEIGKDDFFTIYAGSLDDPSRFQPKIAIFGRNRLPWVEIPDGLTVFDQMPG